MTQLRGVTCRVGSHNVTCHPTQVNTLRLNPSETGQYSVYLSRRDARLSWHSWLDSALVQLSGLVHVSCKNFLQAVSSLLEWLIIVPLTAVNSREVVVGNPVSNTNIPSTGPRPTEPATLTWRLFRIPVHSSAIHVVNTDRLTFKQRHCCVWPAIQHVCVLHGYPAVWTDCCTYRPSIMSLKYSSN